MRKRSLLSLAMAASLLLIAACGGAGVPEEQGTRQERPAEQEGATASAQPSEEERPKTVRFTDSAGTAHEIALPLERAIVLNRNTAEALKLLGVDRQIIATGDTTIENNAYLGFDDRPDIGKTGEVNLELLLSLKPQVVFAYTNRPDRTLEDKLIPAGIQVIRINNYLPERMDAELQLLGELFEEEERAASFLEWKHGIEKQLADRVADIREEEKKEVMALSVGFLNSNGGYRVFPSQSIGGAPGVGEGYATILAGGKDAADLQWDPGEASTTILVDEEYVLSRDPEVLTLHGTWLGGYHAADDGEHREVVDHIMAISSVPQLTAGKQKEIYIFHTNIIGSDKRYIGALQLAKYLYPDRFADVNADDYLREYFERWLEVPYQGVWHYSAKAE